MKPLRHRLGQLALAATTLFGTAVAARDAKADPTGDLNEYAGGLFGEGGSGNANVQSVTGAMSYSYSFALPPARGPIQPSLGLSYSSSAREREAGYGWALALPTIELKPLSGFPTFASDGSPIGEERYTLSGAPIVHICNVGGCPAEPNTAGHPTWATGWRYFRHQVEGSYARIYQSPDRRTWRVQLKGGRVLELGETKPTSGWDDFPVSAAIETDRDIPSGIVRWRLVVDRDGIHPKNAAVYKWDSLGGRGLLYLTSVYDTPTLVGDSGSLASFANHTQLDWQPSGVIDTRYAHVDRAIPDHRLVRVATASKPWSGNGAREVVRTYELEYLMQRQGFYVEGQHAPLWGHSFLKKITLRGSCGAVENGAGSIASPVCQALAPLPPTTFQYGRP